MSELPTLDEDQQAAVDAYLDVDSGLVTLGSVPGSGKSTVGAKTIARVLFERAAAGDPAPADHVLAASFSKEDAADIVPDVVAWLETLFARGEVPDGIDRAAVDDLVAGIREAPHIGTIDSVLRSVFADVATTVGFDAMPTVGNAALTQRLHVDVYDALVESGELTSELALLQDAYPADTWDGDVRELLEEAFTYCRRHDATVAECVDRFHAAVDANYDGGEPASFGDVLEAVAAYRDEATVDRVRTDLDAADREELLTADQRLYAEWHAAVDAFGDALAAYADRYDRRCVERGVVSHLDCAYWVDRFFTADEYAGSRRDRLLDRYHHGIESVVVDEAQDVSRIQHDALAHLVDGDTRVLLAGDLHQCIYHWRDASPALFRRAMQAGEYFGRSWGSHTAETTAQNYRSRPGIVRFANAVADRSLNHPERGGLGDLDAATPSLSANRDPGEAPSVHVPAFPSAGVPGDESWVDPEAGGREAAVVASYVAGAIEDGRLRTTDGDVPSITVLFNTRRHMDAYATAFEARGFTVADASAHLFGSPVVRAVVDVVDWLADPTDPDRTRTLLTDSALAGATSEGRDADALAPVVDAVAAADWAIPAALDRDDLADVDDDLREVLAGLVSLASDRRRLAAEPAAVRVREIIDRLHFEADPIGLETDAVRDAADSDADRARRVATLDRLVALIEEWEGEDRYATADLAELFAPFMAEPKRGPIQPVGDPDAVDVVFRTVHNMKGDQDEVVVLADTATRHGPAAFDTSRLATAGDAAALAPPATAADEATTLPGVEGGLYAPDATPARNPGPDAAGLRWRPEYWQRGKNRDGHHDHLGPPVRRDAVAAERAEAWRTLHVALTRAADHLVVPLPRDDDLLSRRDHWAGLLYDVLGEDVVSTSGLHDVDLPTGDGALEPTRVAVNGVAPMATVDLPGAAARTPPLRRPGPVATDQVSGAWTPRFVSPSTLAAHVDAPAESVVPAIRNENVHTDNPAVDEGLPLPFDDVSTDEIGDVVHALVTALVEVPAADLSTPSPETRAAVEHILDRHVDDAVEGGEVDGLREFLLDWVVPDLADSSLWDRLERAEAVYADEPLHDVARVGDVAVELQGEADLLLVLPDGTHCVEDVKTALTTPTSDQRRRYKLQVDAYAWVLTRQVPDVDVVPRVTTVGAVTDEYGLDWPIGTWRDHLRAIGGDG